MTKTDNFNQVSTIQVSKFLNASSQELNRSSINFTRVDDCSTNPRNFTNSDYFSSGPDLSQFRDCLYGDNCPICSKLGQSIAYNEHKDTIECVQKSGMAFEKSIAVSGEDQKPENGISGRSKLPENSIICSDNGASYASDLPENYFNENSHFSAKDCSEVYGDSCSVCRRQQK